MKLTSIALLLAGASVLAACNTATDAKLNEDREALYSQALAQQGRPEADKLRDAGRKPQQVMQFAGITQGMTVLDIIASGGYYTEVLSHRVGEKGKVLAHNTKFMLSVMDGRFAKEITDRLADERLANVERFEKEFGDFELNGEVDAATMVLNYHDIYNFPAESRMALLQEIKQALKPGGIFLLIDAQASPGEHNKELHRINSDIVKDEVLRAGFMLEKEGGFLSNPKDDHSKVVFDPSIRGKTDRFVFIFKKISA